MITDPAAYAPFDVALHSEDLSVPVRLTWRQGIRESRGVFYTKLGGPVAFLASATMTVIGIGLYVFASSPIHAWLGIVYLALFSRWSPLSCFVDRGMARVRWFRPEPSARWILGERELAMSPPMARGSIGWAKISQIGVVADTAIVVHGNGGHGIAAQAGGPSVEDIVSQLERRTGLAAKRPNRLLWFLTFGPGF